MGIQRTTPTNEPAIPQKKETAEKKKRSLNTDPAAEIVRAAHLPKATGLSAVTIWRRRKAGQFVPAIKLGDNSVGFRRADIAAWLAARAVLVLIVAFAVTFVQSRPPSVEAGQAHLGASRAEGQTETATTVVPPCLS